MRILKDFFNNLPGLIPEKSLFAFYFVHWWLEKDIWIQLKLESTKKSYLTNTLVVIHSESRKTEQVTMKANFIHTWRLESEFGIKNLIFPWTSELAWIWHFFEKIWFFLIALALATLWQNLFQTYGGLSFVEKTLRRQFCNQMLPVQECSKRAKFSQKMQISR